MNTQTPQDKFGAVRKGLLEFLVLKIIAHKESYAADILASLEKTDFATQEGTLYPLLSKLRREEVVDYEWVESEAGPPRKYYRLTTKGRKALDEFEKYWETIKHTIKTIGHHE